MLISQPERLGPPQQHVQLLPSLRIHKITANSSTNHTGILPAARHRPTGTAILQKSRLELSASLQYHQLPAGIAQWASPARTAHKRCLIFTTERVPEPATQRELVSLHGRLQRLQHYNWSQRGQWYNKWNMEQLQHTYPKEMTFRHLPSFICIIATCFIAIKFIYTLIIFFRKAISYVERYKTVFHHLQTWAAHVFGIKLCLK